MNQQRALCHTVCGGICAVLAILSARAAAAPGDEALVVLTQPRTVRGEPAGLHAHVLRQSPELIPEARLELPHIRLDQAMQPLFGGRLAVLLARGPVRGAAETVNEFVMLRTAPLDQIPLPWTPGWEPAAILAEAVPVGDACRLVLLERRLGAQAAPRGRARVFAVRLREASPQFTLLGQWDLHGAPAVGAAHWEDGRVFIACEGPRADSAAIVSIHLHTGEQQYATLKPAHEAVLSAAPAALAVVDGGARLVLLESAYSLVRRDGGRTSAVRLLDAGTLHELGVPAAVPGAAPRNAPALIALHSRLIVNTADAASGFAYATAVEPGDAGVFKREEWGFRDVAEGPRAAASPDGARLAVAGGKSLRLMAAAQGRARAAFPAQDAIEAIAWGRQALYVADGPRLRRIAQGSDALSPEIQRFDGFIVDMLVVSDPGHEPAQPRNALLRLPPRITLDADTPGRDRRSIPVTVPHGMRAGLAYDTGAAPWLSAVLEHTPHGEARLVLSLNRQHLQTPGEHRTWIHVRADADAPPNPPSAIQDRVEVVALAYARHTRAVEWQSSTGLDALAGLIAKPPLHLSQRVRRGPIAQAPRSSAAVVVRLDDVARGAITRQVLLEYVSGGGGLLVIAGHAPDIAGEGLRRWLEPLGLLIDPAREVSGKFAIPKSTVAAFGMDHLAVAAGAYMETTRPMAFTVPGPAPGTAAVALVQHGYGRLAVLASGSPLEDVALAQPANRRFARALFGWLAGVHAAVRDADNDGLRDDVEDADADGERGPRETDFLNPDTDGDGVPDGVEDSNLNGIMDEGETDPRRADTDGDGLLDGADADPLPSAAAPAILALQPSGGPAEGGTFVELTGRNFPVNPHVWFGDRRAPVVFRTDSTRIVAAAPPRIFSELTGPMSVRIADPLDTREYVLKEAYTYRPPSAVTLTLAPAARVQRAYDGYRGMIALALDIPEVRIADAAFYLRTEPAVESMEGVFVPAPSLIQSGRELRVTRYGAGEFHFVLGPGEPLAHGIDLGTFTWRLAEAVPRADALRWYVLYPDVRVLWGSNVDVSTNDVAVRLNLLDAQAVPARPPDPAALL